MASRSARLAATRVAESRSTRARQDKTAARPVGLVHDFLLTAHRGGERTFAAIADCWPGAPVYTLLYSESGTGGRFVGHPVRTSYLQRLHLGESNFRSLLPLYPRAVEHLPVGGHPLVISSSHAFAHGIEPAEDAVHICYSHTPFRYAWHERELALAEANRAVRPLLRRSLTRIRHWDREASLRVSHYIANSETTRRRIGDCYGRDATVIHPPVEVDRFEPGEPEDFFLTVGELVAHKRLDVALEAARLAEVPIKVVGDGPASRTLRQQFRSAEFLGRVPDRELDRLYARARALVVPGVEEFGIAAVEAQAAGRPVLALDAGGAQETVIDGATGVLVAESKPEVFAEAMRGIDFSSFMSDRARTNAQRFSTANFQRRLLDEVARATPAID